MLGGIEFGHGDIFLQSRMSTLHNMHIPVPMVGISLLPDLVNESKRIGSLCQRGKKPKFL